jgi:hypothetical protein
MFTLPGIPASRSIHTLTPNQARTLDARAGVRIAVHSGCLWITQPHDGTDYFVQEGMSLVLHSAGVVLQAHQAGTQASNASARFSVEEIRTSLLQRLAPRPKWFSRIGVNTFLQVRRFIP